MKVAATSHSVTRQHIAIGMETVLQWYHHFVLTWVAVINSSSLLDFTRVKFLCFEADQFYIAFLTVLGRSFVAQTDTLLFDNLLLIYEWDIREVM